MTFHHFKRFGYEVFTPFFLQFLPKARLTKYRECVIITDHSINWTAKPIVEKSGSKRIYIGMTLL